METPLKKLMGLVQGSLPFGCFWFLRWEVAPEQTERSEPVQASEINI